VHKVIAFSMMKMKEDYDNQHPKEVSQKNSDSSKRINYKKEEVKSLKHFKKKKRRKMH
jgi:hypothetical protein